MVWWRFVALIFVTWAGPAGAAPTPDVARVEENLLYHLVRMVTWPPSAFVDDATPVTVCFVGDNVGALADLARRRAARLAETRAPGRALTVKVVRVAELAGADEAGMQQRLGSCHVAYFDTLLPRLDVVTRSLWGRPVLTVGDGAAFAQRHGIIAFVLDDRRVVLHANLARARSGGLRLGARLLQHATIVEAPRP